MARIPSRAIATLVLTLLWGLSHAQETEQYEPDPPDRAARLSYVEGEVSMQPAGEEEWAPALLNRPLTTGDKLWAEQNARAEVQVGPAEVRLGSSTGFSFLNVDDNTIQMRMTAGIVYVSVPTLRDSEQIEIDTPNVAVSLLRAGSYRIEVNDAGDSTVVKVVEGSAQATGPSQDVVVHAQQVVTFNGVEDLVARHGTLGAPDEFDSWNLERDRHDERVASSRTAQYVSPDVTGYEDLEDNGTWSSEAEYGYVWTPRVAVGWAPYSYGRWVWVAPWGWSWIDDARWGYAPFHYGRWANIRSRWCWVPGPRHVRAVYAPALVGWGGLHGGNVSWFPLGPREVYVPGRHFSRNYWERVNFSNTYVSRARFNEAVENRITDTVYRNRSAPGGLTVMPRNAFTSAGRTGDHRGRLNQQELSTAIASAVPPRIAPVQESRLGGPRRPNVRIPPASLANRQVVVRRDPPAAAARYARRPTISTGVAQEIARPARAPARNNGYNGNEAAFRDRQDRPPRAERPVNESGSPATHSSVFDRNAIAERVREDRDRQGRETQQRESAQQRETLQQRDAVNSQRWQRQDDQRQPQVRERPQHAQEAIRQAAERQIEYRQRQEQHQRNEQPRNEQPRNEQPRVERPQVERPVQQRPQAEPQAERQQRSESQRPAESRPQPHGRQDGNNRAKRD